MVKKKTKNGKAMIDSLGSIKKRKFVEIYSQDEVRGNISFTCSAVEVSRQTYYNCFEKDKRFRNKMKEAKLQMCDDMEQILISRAVDKSDTALIFWLKYRHPDYKQENLLAVRADGEKIEVVIRGYKD